MTYAVFYYERDCEAEDRIKAISLLMLTPESKFSGFDAWHSGLKTKKLSSNKTEVLAGYLACCEAQVSSVSIIKFPKELTTDKHLLIFGDAYLGCITVKLKKDELLNRVQLSESLDKNEYLEGWLNIDIEMLKDRIKNIGLTELEVQELKTLQAASFKPIDKWIQNRKKSIEKSINQLPKLLVRGF